MRIWRGQWVIKAAAALAIAAVLVGLINWEENERLYTQRELLSLLAETYGEEFIIVDCREVRREYVGGTYAHRGNVYTLSPAEDPELTFEAWDFIRVTEFNLGGPAARRYHSLGVFYVDAALARDMERLCRELGIENLGGNGTNLKLSAERWEEQLEALDDFFEGCNDRSPYKQAGPYVVASLTLRLDTGRGTVARCDAMYRSDGVYGLNEKGIQRVLAECREKNQAIVAMAFPIWDFLVENDLERELAWPWGQDLAYEDERDPWARMHVYVETEEELDALLALLEEFAEKADFAAEEVFSTPGALALDEEVQLSIHIKQYIQTWYPFRPGEERLAFCAETYKARFEGSMFWEREITGRDPEREGEQETITISGQQAPDEMGTAGLEEEDGQ